MKKPVRAGRRVLPTLIGSTTDLYDALMSLYGELQWLSENPHEQFRVCALMKGVLQWVDECEGNAVSPPVVDRAPGLGDETAGPVPAGKDPQWGDWDAHKARVVKEATRPQSTARQPRRQRRRN